MKRIEITDIMLSIGVVGIPIAALLLNGMDPAVAFIWAGCLMGTSYRQGQRDILKRYGITEPVEL